jgi:hypothetical protein
LSTHVDLDDKSGDGRERDKELHGLLRRRRCQRIVSRRTQHCG